MRLRAQAVTYRAGGRALVAEVTLDVRPGEFLALVGPNGSGKTTLISMLAGLRRPHGGAVTLDGRPLRDLPRREVARALALVEQQAETGERLTAREVVRLGRTPHLGPWSPWSEHDERIVEDALEAVDMAGFAERVWQSLSGGERQRLHIARALAQEPRVLILDEPTNHLDIESVAVLERALQAFDGALLVVSHDRRFLDAIGIERTIKLAAAGDRQASPRRG